MNKFWNISISTFIPITIIIAVFILIIESRFEFEIDGVFTASISFIFFALGVIIVGSYYYPKLLIIFKAFEWLHDPVDLFGIKSPIISNVSQALIVGAFFTIFGLLGFIKGILILVGLV